MKHYAFAVKNIDWDYKSLVEEDNKALGIGLPTAPAQIDNSFTTDEMDLWKRDTDKQMVKAMSYPIDGLPTSLKVYLPHIELTSLDDLVKGEWVGFNETLWDKDYFDGPETWADQIQMAIEYAIEDHFDSLAASWEIEFIGVVDRPASPHQNRKWVTI